MTITNRPRVGGPATNDEVSMSDRSLSPGGRLAALGAYGFEAQEPVILAALASGDPILLIGRSGTGKTFLLSAVSHTRRRSITGKACSMATGMIVGPAARIRARCQGWNRRSIPGKAFSGFSPFIVYGVERCVSSLGRTTMLWAYWLTFSLRAE